MFNRMGVIRRLITDYDNKFSISKNNNLWNKLCSSLDVAEDTELAIRAYSKSKNTKSEGVKYLRLYGLLQALYTQQLAFNGICEVLGISYVLDDPTLKEIRVDRNDSVGHPTNRRTGCYHYIIRTSIAKSGFDLISFDKVSKSSHRHIAVNDLIMQQKGKVIKILKKVNTKIVKELKKE